jgi:hypothetical protein
MLKHTLIERIGVQIKRILVDSTQLSFNMITKRKYHGIRTIMSERKATSVVRV